MESKLINYSIFIEKRPDMEVHTEVAIVSCINSAYVLLDGECASLISQVDKFNMVDDRSSLDTTHELYRTDFELGQLQEALVFQVQYVLNMGNDFTVGGGSYSIGNINSSYSRPEGRELIAPGVYKLLSNARVYHLNAFGSFSNQNTNEIPLSTSKEIMERVKNEYVAQNQPNAQVGQVAYVNQSKQIDFGNPQDLNITTYNTNRIAGPEGYRNNYYEIDSVPNIAFFGPDYNGTYSAVHRQEMIDYVNQNAGESLGQEIAQIKQEQEEQNNKINQNKNLIDSTYEEAIGAVRKNAEQDETIRRQETRIESNWNTINNLNQRVGTNTTNIQTNTNNITALDSRLVNVSGLLNQTIDGLRTLRPFKFVGLYDSQRTYMLNEMVSLNDIFYLSLEDNNSTTPPSDKWIIMKDFQQVDLSEYPTKLEVEAIKNNLQQSITSNTTNITALTNRTNTIEQNYVSKTTTTPQTIASQITFTQTDMVLKFNSGTNNSAYLAGFKSNNQRVWYFGKGSSTSDNFIIGADRGVIKLEPSTQVDVSNKRIINVADPTAIKDAVNKQYVDNNTLSKTSTTSQTVAGPVSFTQPITIPTPTADTNAATKAYVDTAIQNITPGSGGSVDTSNFATLNTAQTITGAKTFNNNVVISKNPTPLILKANTNDKTYMLIKSSDDTTNFSLGANSSNTSLEVNRGDLTFQTVQANKNVNFVNVARVKFNRSILEAGTEINAGFGGLNVKFIPEDNSTKTLQFYNANPNDTRRFKLLVPEPTEAQNPTTKNYVDTAIAGINTSGNVPQQTLDQINTNTTNITNLQNEVSGHTTNISALQNQVNVNVNRIGTNTNSINQLNTKDTQNVKLSGDQTITGQKTFTNRIFANGGITNLPDPTNTQEAANKRYVDRTVDQMINIYSDNTTKYSNLQTINVSNLFSRTNINYNKPLIVSFTRYNGNNNTQLGTHTGIIYVGTGNKHMLISDTYVEVRDGNMANGSRCGLLITPNQIKVQCWNGGDKIGNILIYGWAKALS